MYKYILFGFLVLFSVNSAKAQTCSVNAGVDSRICVSGGTMTLVGNAAGAFSSSASWSLVSGPNVPTITSPTSATTTVTGFVAGTYRFRYHAVCSDASPVSDTVSVIVDAVPVFTAGTDTFVCGTSRSMNATLPAGATGVWSVVATSASAMPAAAITFSSGLPNALMTIPNNQNCPKEFHAIYTVTQGACVSRDTAKVGFGGQRAMLYAADATICGTSYAPYMYYPGCGSSYSAVQLAGPSTATITNYVSPAVGASQFGLNYSNLMTGVYTFALSANLCDGSVWRDTFNLTVGSTVPVTDPDVPAQYLCSDQFDTVYYSQPRVSLLPGEKITYDFSGIYGATPGGTLTPPTLDTIGNILRWRNVVHPDTNATGGWFYAVPYTVTNGICTRSGNAVIFLYGRMATRSFQSVINLPCGATSGNIAVPTSGSLTGFTSGGTTITRPAGAPNPTFSGSTASGLQPGRYVFSFQHQINSGCEFRTAVVEVNVSAPAGAANAGTDQVLSCGVDSTVLSGNVPLAGQLGTWQLVSGPSTVVLTNPNSANLLVKNLLPGVYTFRWSIANGSTCPAASDDMRVVVMSTITAADAGPDRSVCYGYTTALNANAPTLGTTGRWQQIGGPAVSIADTTSAATSFTGSVASTVYTFTWTLTNPCGTATDTVVITTTASQGPSNAVISTADTCITSSGFSSITLNAVAPTLGTGTWSQLSGPTASIGTPTSATTTVSLLFSLREYKFVWAVSATGCETLRDTVSIANRGTAALYASAGLDKYICADTVRMTGNTLTVDRVGTWSQIGGPGSTIDSVNKPTAFVSGLVNGNTYDYVWTVSLGVCPVARDTVHIGVSGLPSTAIARADTLVCNNVLGVNTGLSLPLTATAPTSGVGAWAILESPYGGASITNPSLPTTTGIFRGGVTILAWTVVNGACPASRDTVTIEVAPKADAPANASLCETSSYALRGTQPGSGTVLWTQTAGPTTATITQPTSAFTNINNMANGVYKFSYTLTHPVSGCSSVDSITITNSARPTANARRDSVFCYRPSGGTPLYLIADTPSLGTGVWSRISGSGTVSFSPGTAANPATATVSSSGSGLQQFRWTVTNGACQAIDVKDVLIEQLPAPGIVITPTTACGDTFTVKGTAPSLSFNYAWSFPKARIKDTAGIGLTGPIANNFLISDTNSVYLTITNPATGCTAKDSSSFIVSCSYLPLPLSFTKTYATTEQCAVQLAWSFNRSPRGSLMGFDIERSINGKHYELLASLDADADQFVDTKAAEGTWYYRIIARGTGTERAYAPTQVVSVSNCFGNRVSVYPNPTKDRVNVLFRGNAQERIYRLYNAQGMLLRQGLLDSSAETVVDVQGLPPGLYIFQFLLDGTIDTHSIQIIR